MEIEELVAAIEAGRIIPSRHSLSEAAADNLVLGEICLSATEEGEVIEDYPDAYPMPACLIWDLTRWMSQFILSGDTMK